MSVPTADGRIDPQFMFSDHANIHSAQLEEKQRRLLERIPFINAFLDADEKILLVTTCVSPTSILERLTTGWVFAYLNRALLVVTNEGLIHIPTTPGFGYRNSIAKCRYGDCKVLTGGWSVFVEYGTGKKERYQRMPREYRRKLKRYFQTLSIGGDVAPTAEKRHLCPRCTAVLPSDTYECSSCGLAFKDMRFTASRWQWIPGSGYFYTGHPILGAIDFMAGLYLATGALLSVLGIFEGGPAGWFGTIFFGGLLVFQKMLAVHCTKRHISEYLPKDVDVELRPATPGAAPMHDLS